MESLLPERKSELHQYGEAVAAAGFTEPQRVPALPQQAGDGGW